VNIHCFSAASLHHLVMVVSGNIPYSHSSSHVQECVPRVAHRAPTERGEARLERFLFSPSAESEFNTETY
jgi:hypothetical protein